jgi:nitric oxide dioxygenase
LIAAWAEAYGLLAKALSDEEARMYKEAGINAGDLFEMRVSAVEVQSTQVKSFVLSPADGSVAPAFLPGQYMSVAIDLPGGLRQLRQYSLSDAPNAQHLRISVKREVAGKETPAGMVSNWLHDNVQVGSVIKASKPFGDFQPDAEGTDPIVLLSAGVGVTPMISVLNRIAQVAPQRHVIFAHAARNIAHHPHQDDVEKALARMPNLQTVYFYEEAHEAQHKDSYVPGRMKVASLPKWDKNRAKVYMCGPLPFMQQQWADLIAHDVPQQALHREVFGPDMLDHLI